MKRTVFLNSSVVYFVICHLLEMVIWFLALRRLMAFPHQGKRSISPVWHSFLPVLFLLALSLSLTHSSPSFQFNASFTEKLRETERERGDCIVKCWWYNILFRSSESLAAFPLQICAKHYFLNVNKKHFKMEFPSTDDMRLKNCFFLS